MIVPLAITRQNEIQAAVDRIKARYSSDVRQIRYEISEDWSGQWAIVFRVLLTDDAARRRLSNVASEVVHGLANELDFYGLGVFPYHDFRSESEQAVLQEETWV
jgi:hypothetical protein